MCHREINMGCHSEKEMACYVRGYHVYVWAAAIGEVLVCSREPTSLYFFRCEIILE